MLQSWKRQFIGRKSIDFASKVIEDMAKETKDIISQICDQHIELNSKVTFEVFKFTILMLLWIIFNRIAWANKGITVPFRSSYEKVQKRHQKAAAKPVAK